MSLNGKLIKAGKTRWLDIGCGGNFADGFEYVDVYPEDVLDQKYRDKYHRLDIVTASDTQLGGLGAYDLIRMQHTFEHLTFEDGYRALTNCARLLAPDGYILITVPDLRKHVETYLHGTYKNWAGFIDWATRRIPIDAPDSAYFSVFAHSMTYEPHKWCYDYEGLEYQLKRTKLFKNIEQLAPDHALAAVPFTHNRPEEDVCVLAQKH